MEGYSYTYMYIIGDMIYHFSFFLFLTISFFFDFSFFLVYFKLFLFLTVILEFMLEQAIKSKRIIIYVSYVKRFKGESLGVIN